MRRIPVMVLVCLVFGMVMSNRVIAEEYIDVIMKHPVLYDDLTASLRGGESIDTPSLTQAAAGPIFRQAAYRPSLPATSISKCKPAPCQPLQACAPACGPPSCMLPKRMCRQVEPSVQVFFANVRGTVRQGAWGGVFPATDIDFTNDLGLPSSRVLLEYAIRCQFAPHWAAFYSIMPIELEATHTLDKNLFYHQWVLRPGTLVHTKWDFTYQRVGLLYQPILTCNAAVSVFAGWMFNEQSIRLKSLACTGTCFEGSRTRNMVTTGLELQKCIQTKCTGATLSCDSKAGISFLDGTFGVDVQAGLRYSVPLGANRWGYAKGGYRYLSLSESRDDLRLDATFGGGFVEGGMIF